MFEAVIAVLVYAMGVYLALGLMFSVVFVSVGVQRTDPQAKGAGPAFRLLILPGMMAFWPLLLSRWRRGIAEPPAERTAHG